MLDACAQEVRMSDESRGIGTLEYKGNGTSMGAVPAVLRQLAQNQLPKVNI